MQSLFKCFVLESTARGFMIRADLDKNLTEQMPLTTIVEVTMITSSSASSSCDKYNLSGRVYSKKHLHLDKQRLMDNRVDRYFVTLMLDTLSLLIIDKTVQQQLLSRLSLLTDRIETKGTSQRKPK